MDSSSTRSPQQTVVIKVGTSSLIREDTNAPNLTSLARICEVVRCLTDEGHRVCLVSSGAVGMGCQLLRLQSRPTEMPKKQALAAIGQGALMRLYSDLFASLSLVCGQVLVTAESLASQSQCARAQSTFQELFEYKAIPIVNENDTINVQELRIGDNDTLSAQVSVLVQADWLFLLTDVDFLYTANPTTNPNATPIKEVHSLADLEVDTSTQGTQWGTGGMATKLTAARIATSAGCRLAICNSQKPEYIRGIIRGELLGTVFHAAPYKVTDRKRWLLSVQVRGSVTVDAGCEAALRSKKNLYAAGIVAVEGPFGPMDAVELISSSNRAASSNGAGAGAGAGAGGGRPFARGLVNFSSADIDRMKGLHSSQYPEDLKDLSTDKIMFRENIALLSHGSP